MFQLWSRGSPLIPIVSVPVTRSSCVLSSLFSTKARVSAAELTEKIAKAKSIVDFLGSSTSWSRLGPVYELAIQDFRDPTLSLSPRQSIADVGCDHGLLSLALASSLQFNRVIASDISKAALENGVKSNYARLMHFIEENHKNVKLGDIELNIGDGLKGLDSLEDNIGIICLCGIGVNTIIKILNGTSSSNSGEQLLLLDHFNCNRLVLQPTNSRPRNMVTLYQALERNNWEVSEEKLSFVSGRWYFSVSFEKQRPIDDCHSSFRDFNHSIVLGSRLSDDSTEEYEKYIDHHKKWIFNDFDSNKRSSIFHPEDQIWLNSLQLKKNN